MAAERPFFERPETIRAVHDLADADRLTVVVGAGVSAELGHPTWTAMLNELLMLAAQEVGLAAGSREADAFVDWTMRQEGALGAAEVARALLGEGCDKAIQQSLYRDVAANAPPGPSARAVAAIQSRRRTSCEIVTTNYDTGIENALEDAGVSFETLTGPDDPQVGRVAVRHLHGFVTRKARKPSGLVLSQRDYARLDSSAWQHELLVDRLETSTCLFVGSGMTDPNLLHYLHRASADRGRRHVAVMPRQADDWYGTSAPSEVRTAREQSLAARWATVGVEVLRPDFFVQSAQFLYEVLLRMDRGAAAVPYVARLNAWAEQLKGLLMLEDRTAFSGVQDTLTEEVAGWLEGVRERLAGAVAMSPKERLGLHLWVRRPSAHAMFLWGSSDRAWRDPTTLEPVPITLPSNWTAVRAFCRGTPIRETNAVSMSRWNTLRGVPLMVQQGVERLPVGALTLASTLPKAQSSLVKIDPDVVDELHTYLVTNAAQLLGPDPTA